VNVLVDTSVWSLALRRQAGDLSGREKKVVEELRELVAEGRGRIIGVIRQELLSGIKSEAQFEKLRLTLVSFADEMLETSDYEAAARLSNVCRSKGKGTSLVDMLICAVAIQREWVVFTVDGDFAEYAEILPVKLHVIRK
jgi:predicted nucleic acid-binding protein